MRVTRQPSRLCSERRRDRLGAARSGRSYRRASAEEVTLVTGKAVAAAGRRPSDWDLESFLRFALLQVGDWVKFAEAKNTALLIADAGAFAALMAIALREQTAGFFVSAYMWEAVVCVALGAVFGLVAFIPQLHVPAKHRRRARSGPLNLLFYGDVATLDPEEYMAALRAEFGESAACPLELEYAKQIVDISRVALRKYRWFRIAAVATMSSIATPIPVLLLLGLSAFGRRRRQNREVGT